MPFERLMWALKKERELEACLIWVGVDKEEAAFTTRQSEAFHCAQAEGQQIRAPTHGKKQKLKQKKKQETLS
jgi:hypothetical protein